MSGSGHRPIVIGPVLITLFVVAACAGGPQSPDPSSASGMESISLWNEPGPFCGRCDSVKGLREAPGKLGIPNLSMPWDQWTLASPA
ncbi:MAG: hypothetical protein JF625_27915 [Inquilinus limosus]|uniref:Uncharacterized protein n=1 Tax=Inquilinus limosus TaxID=171674 RepID=A0A952KKJ0_9PROT|nr:hypothetical protein [Inquilinus limosus]